LAEEAVALPEGTLELRLVECRRWGELHSQFVEQLTAVGRPTLDEIEIIGEEGHRAHFAEEVGYPARAALIDEYPVPPPK
jgi:hypothetical protein